MAVAQKDRVGGTVELGPRSLALLRRIELALELLIDQVVPDTGEASEDDAEAV
jgi:hypothetical protein